MDKDQLVRFDWAIKRLLRNKANFKVLEGFLTSLLGRPIKIIQILESEGNKDFEENKSNRVDILAQEEDGAKIIIEVQNESEDSYFHRILFGTSKLINDFLKEGQSYKEITKIYSVNIIYFNLGDGSDYVYHGKTEFRGIHDHKLLELPFKMQEKFKVKEISEIYPEYFILRVKGFDKVAVEPLDQWIYFLRHSRLPERADAPGLKEAAEVMRLASLSPEERRAYHKYLDNMQSLEEVVESRYTDGLFEGRAEGRVEGIAEGEQNQAWKDAEGFFKAGVSLEIIAGVTNIPLEDLKARLTQG